MSVYPRGSGAAVSGLLVLGALLALLVAAWAVALGAGTTELDRADARLAGEARSASAGFSALVATGDARAGTLPASRSPDTKSSDAAIIIHVRQALARRFGGAASSIIVQFSDGILTVSGRVNSPLQKRQEEQAAAEIDGITKVNNLLVVTPAR